MPKRTGDDTWRDWWNRVSSNLNVPILQLPTQVSNDDLIWLHTTSAFQRGDKYWTEFVASFFHNDSGEGLSDFVAEICTRIGLADNDEETRRVVSERAELFLNKIIVGRKLTIQPDAGNNGGIINLPPSGSSGISAIECNVPFTRQPRPNEVVKIRAILPKSFKAGLVETDMRVLQSQGWAVISDIDDTIKITDTLDISKLLRNTFGEEAKPTPSFPQFYAHLNQVLNEPAFFYLSASPYNLYPFLLDFIKRTYPIGHIILRDMSWMSVAGLTMSISVGTQEYKTSEMRRVMGQWLPDRNYICIGDSTQTDPESYAEIYKAYPDKVKAIWIRVVTGVDEDEEKKKNAKERFDKAFKGVPVSVWKTFHDVSELGGLAESLLA